MNLPENAHMLKIYVGEELYKGNSAVYEQIIYSARVWGLSGVTITKSDLGFGDAEIRPDDKAHKLRISAQKPVVIEIVDTEEKLMEFVPNLKDMLGENGLITITPTRILHYGSAKSSAA
jgi:PII-like signaling protein